MKRFLTKKEINQKMEEGNIEAVIADYNHKKNWAEAITTALLCGGLLVLAFVR